MLRRILIAAGAVVVVVVAGFAAVIAFNAPSAPPVLAAGNTIPGIAQWNFAELPKPQTLKARDGAPLNYRLYPGRPDRRASCWCTARRVPTSRCSSSPRRCRRPAPLSTRSACAAMAAAARPTATSPTSVSSTTISPTSSKVSGSTSPACIARSWAFPPAAASCCASPAASRPACSTTTSRSRPTSAQDAPTNKPNAGGWAGVAVPRIIALSLLDGFGLPWFQGLPAVHFATDAKASNSRTPVYSFRLAASLQLGRDWRGRPVAHIGAHRDRGRRQRRAVQCRSVQADAASRSIRASA